jgi:hypothetical protein
MEGNKQSKHHVESKHTHASEKSNQITMQQARTLFYIALLRKHAKAGVVEYTRKRRGYLLCSILLSS